MACTLSNKCAKNLSKRTVLLQLIIKNVVTCFFWNTVYNYFHVQSGPKSEASIYSRESFGAVPSDVKVAGLGIGNSLGVQWPLGQKPKTRDG